MKKKLLSLMVVMSLVVSMTLGVTGCGSKSSDSDKKVLKVAFECAYAPYNWTQESPEVGNGKQAVKIKNADGYAYGYEVELAQRIADEMGYELEVYKIEWSSILMGLQDGSYDAVMTGVCYSPERDETYDFSTPYYKIALILAVILIYGLISCYKIGKKDYMGQIKLIAGKNVSLKEELNKEQEYNKIQYKKMQEFVENIAHQIKTPLSVITMKLEMIQELCGINEDICRLITDCTKNTFKIKMFIKKLLDISRIESGKITLSSDEIVIDYIVEESVECSVDDKQKVSVNYGNEDRHRKMYADEGWLLEALINVISNCYEHINQKKGGMVYIDISSNSEVCMITISDNGDGIQDCDVAGIFDRFMSRKSQDEFHAGIGLNLSKLIIEAHHGNIRAGNSDKYGGAQFKIILPLYKFKGKL